MWKDLHGILAYGQMEKKEIADQCEEYTIYVNIILMMIICSTDETALL